MRLISLDPLLVNLADSSGAAYLRVSMVLRVQPSTPIKATTPKPEDKTDKTRPTLDEDQAMLRDVALDVIGRSTGEALLQPSGKDELKAQLRSGFSARVSSVKVVDVLFTEFLVQR